MWAYDERCLLTDCNLISNRSGRIVNDLKVIFL